MYFKLLHKKKKLNVYVFIICIYLFYKSINEFIIIMKIIITIIIIIIIIIFFFFTIFKLKFIANLINMKL